MLSLDEFKQLLAASNPQWADFRMAKAPGTVTPVMVLVSGTSRERSEVIVNAFGVNGVSFQIAADALPTAPEKFDAIEINAHKYVIDMVVEKRCRRTGAVSSFTMYAKGK